MNDEIPKTNNSRRGFFLGLVSGIFMGGLLAAVLMFSFGNAGGVSLAREAFKKAVQDTLGNVSGKRHLVAEIVLNADIVSAPQDVVGKDIVQTERKEVIAGNIDDDSADDGAIAGDALARIASANQNSAPSPAPISPPAPTQSPEAPPTICSFAAKTPISGNVRLNEIAWMGSLIKSGITASAASNDEWIELKNVSGGSISLAGWQMLSSDGGIKVQFESGNSIASQKFSILERSDDDSLSGIGANTIYVGGLSNSGEWLRLFDAKCGLVDEINAVSGWPGGDNTTKATLERNADGLDWHTSVSPGGTPKAENSVPVVVLISPPAPAPSASPLPALAPSPEQPPPTLEPSPAPEFTQISTSGPEPPPPPAPEPPPPSPVPPPEPPPPLSVGLNHLVIAEVHISGDTSTPGHSTDDFVKIYNPTASAINLKGYRLVKRTKTGISDTSLKSWTSDAFVNPSSYYMWANSDYVTIASPPDVTTSGSIAADNGIALREGPADTGTITDAVAWGEAENVFIEGSIFSVNPDDNQILARQFAGGFIIDTDNNSADFTIH